MCIRDRAKAETMYQDSELPKFSVDIHGEGAMKTTLDEKEQYTAQQFMENPREVHRLYAYRQR